MKKRNLLPDPVWNYNTDKWDLGGSYELCRRMRQSDADYETIYTDKVIDAPYGIIVFEGKIVVKTWDPLYRILYLQLMTGIKYSEYLREDPNEET